MSCIVARISTLKQETHNLMSIKDLEELVISTMGEDTWNAIMYFTEERIQEQKEEAEYDKEDILGYDTDLTALRSDVRDTLDGIEELIQYINDTKRLERSHISDELSRMKRQLTESEGYI